MHNNVLSALIGIAHRQMIDIGDATSVYIAMGMCNDSYASVVCTTMIRLNNYGPPAKWSIITGFGLLGPHRIGVMYIHYKGYELSCYIAAEEEDLSLLDTKHQISI